MQRLLAQLAARSTGQDPWAWSIHVYARIMHASARERITHADTPLRTHSCGQRPHTLPRTLADVGTCKRGRTRGCIRPHTCTHADGRAYVRTHAHTHERTSVPVRTHEARTYTDTSGRTDTSARLRPHALTHGREHARRRSHGQTDAREGARANPPAYSGRHGRGDGHEDERTGARGRTRPTARTTDHQRRDSREGCTTSPPENSRTCPQTREKGRRTTFYRGDTKEHLPEHFKTF